MIQEWMAKSTLPRACITDSIPVLLFPNHMNYVFNYPSFDPLRQALHTQWYHHGQQVTDQGE